MQLVAYLFMGAGVFFFLSTAIAMVRFSDVYALLHASSKCLVGGALSIVVALLLQSSDGAMVLRLVLVAFFLLITSPIASHALAETLFRQGYSLENVIYDEFSVCRAGKRDRDGMGRD